MAVILSNYLHLLGFQAKAHTETSSDLDLNKLAVASGLATVENGVLRAPYIGQGFGLAAVSTDMTMTPDLALAAQSEQSIDPAWWVGSGTVKGALNRDPFRCRKYVDGALPFETLKRVDEPTTFIDEARVARVPKRTDMFARAQFGDLGKKQQAAASGGWYARKSAHSFAQRRVLGAFVLLQDGEPSPSGALPTEAERNAANVKAASYFLGIDAVGISRCPDWTWYSHDATGAELVPPHDQAISMIVDQGYETMEGASGDDWIAVAQSMRAYLRFSLLGGVIAKQIRSLGYSAKAHSVMDGEVLQPPLLLLSGLGEVSRIGEVILNPLLGPRLKSGVVTTDMPLFYQETFGPVLAVTTFETEEEAINLANNTEFGLGVSLFSKDIEKMKSLIPKFNDGAVFINSFVKSIPQLPFGGSKNSGIGRELAEEGLKAFVNIKTVVIL